MQPPSPAEYERQKKLIMAHGQALYTGLGFIGLYQLDESTRVDDPRYKRGISYYLSGELAADIKAHETNLRHIREMLDRGPPANQARPRGVLEMKISLTRVSIEFSL